MNVEESYRQIERGVDVRPGGGELILSAVKTYQRRRRTKRLALGSAAACAVLSGSLLAVTLADDGPPSNEIVAGPAEPPDVPEWQQSIRAYKIALLAEASSHSSFTGSAFDNNARLLSVFGVGDPPERVADLMAAHPSSLAVQWESVPFTASRLEEASTLIMEEFPELHSSAISSDFMSLEAWVSAADQDEIPTIQQRAEELTGIPVRVSVHAPAQPL